MGILTDRTKELAPKLNTCIEFARVINEVNDAQTEKEFEDIVSILRPFSHDFALAAEISNTSAGYANHRHLMVGDGLRIKYGDYDGYGSIISPRYYLEYFREYGFQIANVARSPLKSIFIAITPLTKDLVKYSTCEVERKGSWSIRELSWGHSYTTTNRVVRETVKLVSNIRIISNNGQAALIDFNKDQPDNFTLNIESWSDLHCIEDILDLLIDMYTELWDRMKASVQHNANVFKKMRNIIAPFSVAKALA